LDLSSLALGQFVEIVLRDKNFKACVQSIPSKDKLLIKTVIGGRGQGEIPEDREFEKFENGEEVLVFSRCPSVVLSWGGE